MALTMHKKGKTKGEWRRTEKRGRKTQEIKKKKKNLKMGER